MPDMADPEVVMQVMVDDLRDRIETEKRAIRFATARMEALVEAYDGAESALGRYQRAKPEPRPPCDMGCGADMSDCPVHGGDYA